MPEVTAELLAKVKRDLGETGTFNDGAITDLIEEVMDYMSGAGVSDARISASAGTISRGVSDLWDNNGGKVALSPYFKERVTQLALRG
ncbi:MAG: hypothetical protein IIZ09_09365 [Ruminococcus sp.]|jgi:hypothetical protein|nr:hypothetical protein [Ruminococcus sp.]